MSPLLDRQRSGVRLGVIRIGTRVVGEDGKPRPVKLSTFRLTAPERSRIDAAASLYGGEVMPWEPDRGGPQWQVVTQTDRLPVRVPPGGVVEQNYEMWSGRPVVRQRLCDGRTERMGNRSCQCPPDLMERRDRAAMGAACKPVTRLTLVLADLPGLGVWTLTSTGDSAADELASTAELLYGSAARGIMLPATLRLEQRESRGSGKVHQYAVPVLDIGASLAALESGAVPTVAGALTAAPHSRAAIGSGEQGDNRPNNLPADVTPPPDDAMPGDAQSCADLALSAATADEVRQLGAYARQQGWLGEHVRDAAGVLDQLDPVLRARLAALGAPTAADH